MDRTKDVNDRMERHLGASFITLPDGSTVALSDYIWGSFRSAFIVEPHADGPLVIEPFGYGRHGKIPGTELESLAAHTNVPRNPDNGLPKDWEMFALRWRATADLPLNSELLEFAGSVAMQFLYNDKIYGQASLLELLLGHVDLAGPPGSDVKLPVHMRENLMYGMNGRCDSTQAVDKFREYLRSIAPPKVEPGIVAELGTIARMSPEQVKGEIHRVMRKLQPARPATIWLHLEGYVKRTVV